MAGVTGSDGHVRAKNRLKTLKTGELRICAIAFILGKGHFFLADFARFLVHDIHHRGYRHDFGIEITGCLASCGALLRLQGVFIHRIAADVIALRNDFSGLKHRHVNRIVHSDQFRVGLNAHFLGLHQRDGVLTTSCHHINIVDDDLLCCRGNGHQTRRTLTIHCHARNRNWQASAQRNLTCKIAALRTLLKRRAPKDVVNFAAFNTGALNSGFQRVAAERWPERCVKSAAIGFADGGTGG